MAEVITQIEIMKFSGMEKAVFPSGTILTPSAKDWANENKIEIILGGKAENQSSFKSIDIEKMEKSELLKCMTKSVIRNMEKAGSSLNTGELIEAVSRCLEKLGHKVEK